MGYNTSYSLKALPPDHIEDVIHDLMDCFDSSKYALNTSGQSRESIKWYEHEDDMRAFSKKYPEIVFELSGEGEDAEDQWRKYFVNGKMQVCKAEITFEVYHPQKLK